MGGGLTATFDGRVTVPRAPSLLKEKVTGRSVMAWSTWQPQPVAVDGWSVSAIGAKEEPHLI
jgi:hypothetical protein